MIKLFIDTRDNKKTIIKLDKSGKVFIREFNFEKQRAEATLALIEKILQEAEIAACDIDKIYVERGPGSFTGLRVGNSIANALSFSLQIELNDKKPGEMEIPRYE